MCNSAPSNVMHEGVEGGACLQHNMLHWQRLYKE